jgi:hypothetical protein
MARLRRIVSKGTFQFLMRIFGKNNEQKLSSFRPLSIRNDFMSKGRCRL